MKPETIPEQLTQSFLTGHAHQFVFALEIDAHMEVMNTQVPIHPCATCHVSEVEAHRMHLQITNILHHWNKLRQT